MRRFNNSAMPNATTKFSGTLTAVKTSVYSRACRKRVSWNSNWT